MRGRPVQNCVKTATAQPASNEVVQTTTTRRVLPLAPDSRVDFWEYLNGLKFPDDWDKPPGHLLYIYRRIADTGPMPGLEKCTGYITMPDNTRVALTNQEETEFAIGRKYGGGTYRLDSETRKRARRRGPRHLRRRADPCAPNLL